MAHHTGAVIEAQVDWLTVSAHGEEGAAHMRDLAVWLAKEEEAKGNRPKLWRLMGYEGTHVGAIEYGQRDEASCILRLIGDAASVHLDKAMSVAHDVTRIDLAVTWQGDPPDPMVGRNTYTQAELHYASHPNAARPWFTGDASGGYTCYIGARESANFFRVYNKGAECVAQGDQAGIERYRGCWRYELEAKASMAGALSALVLDASDRADTTTRYVHAWATAHGISPMFLVDAPMALIPGFRRRSDADSRIRHLERNVRPTLEWLREAGELDRALTALGLA